MAERIVSPGVFTREKDLSFLPQGIADIGAAIIGPTLKGPAFVPTQVTSFSEFENIFGGTDTRFYVPYTVREYIKNAPSVTVVRVLGLGGYQSSFVRLEVSKSDGTHVTAAVLKPSRNNPTLDLGGVTSASFSGSDDWENFILSIGGTPVSASFDTGSVNYIGKIFSSDPQTTNTDTYLYKNFKFTQSSNGFAAANPLQIVSGSTGEDFTFDYKVATTPYIVSQLSGGSRKNLFKVNTRSHGTDVSDNFKIAIADLSAAGSVPGSDFGSFALKVLRNNPGENNDGEVMEEFTNLNFDPESTNYLPRAIGDRYVTIDTNGKLTYNGDWPNKSVHLYISDYSSNLEGISEDLLPHGFAALSNPTLGTTNLPATQNVTAQTNVNGVFDSNVYYGFDFANEDNKQFLSPIPVGAGSGNNAVFSLENMDGHADAITIGADTFSDATENITLALSAKAQRKFVVPFQGGFDGDNPTTLKATGGDIVGTNQQGFDCSTSTASGSISYKRAINSISNPDEFDINLLVTPGIIHELHSTVSNHGISKVESRADAFYVMDGSRWGRSVSNSVSDINTLDTNYAGVYYPWVKYQDVDRNLPVWVPPSVVIPGVISFTDSVAHEWFAPAGLNRGGLSSVIEAKTRLTHTERDELYEGRVNPIATFPGQGVVVFGQKTLQGKPSALDRINVRRLLIRLRKFIASSSRYLVFEQNTATTRNRFLNIVNPFLSSVQQNSGLSAFKVVMDESNNTPDVVDRNQLVGQRCIQPTRTAENIVLDLVVQPTGAAFPE